MKPAVLAVTQRIRERSAASRTAYLARIDKLARWTFPLLEDGGVLVALSSR